VEDAGGELLRPPRRGRDRLARAFAVAPHRYAAAGRARAPPRWATACRCWCTAPDRPDLFARICGYFDSAGFSIQDAKIHTTRAGFALDTFQVVSRRSRPDRKRSYRDLISLVETQAAQALASDGPLPEPSRGRVSRRVKSFPVTPRVSLRPTSVRSAGCSPSPPATAPACCTPSPGCWPATTSTCSWPRSARWASGSRTPSWSTARRCSSPRRRCSIESELLDAVAPPG
jgi:hypothetical protein